MFTLALVHSSSGAAASASPFQCYACGGTHKACQDTFNVTVSKNLLHTCSAEKKETACFKYINTDKQVQRGCTADGETNTCPPKNVDKTGSSAGVAWCYRCYSSQCNSAPGLVSLAGQSIMVITTLLGAKAIYKGF